MNVPLWESGRMPFRSIIPGVHQLSLGSVNCFLLETDDGLVLVDTGLPEHAPAVQSAIEAAGWKHPSHIVLTHCHPDHAGGASFLRAETGARTWAHVEDANLIEEGVGLRPLRPAPGAINGMLHKMLLSRMSSAMPGCVIDRRVENGHMLPGGLIVVHTPGHSAGHLCLLWPAKRLLVAGDVCSHLGWLRPSPVYEDYAQGLASLRKLGGLDFSLALFGHGTPVRKQGTARFQARFGRP